MQESFNCIVDAPWWSLLLSNMLVQSWTRSKTSTFLGNNLNSGFHPVWYQFCHLDFCTKDNTKRNAWLIDIHYQENVSTHYILLARFGDTCPEIAGLQQINTKLFWLFIPSLRWHNSILMRVLSARMTMFPHLEAMRALKSKINDGLRSHQIWSPMEDFRLTC